MPTLEAPSPTSSRLKTLRGNNLARVKFLDKAADLLVRSGGGLVIVFVGLIFFFILIEILPLFTKPHSHVAAEGISPAGPAGETVPMLTGVDEYEEFVFSVYSDSAAVQLRRLHDKSQPPQLVPLKLLEGRKAVCGYRGAQQGYLYFGTNDGRLLIVQARFPATFDDEGERHVRPDIKEIALIHLPGLDEPVKQVYGRVNSRTGNITFSAVTESNRLFYGYFTMDAIALAEANQGMLEGTQAADAAMPGEEPPLKALELEYQFPRPIRQQILDFEMNRLFVVTDDGVLYQFYLEEDASAPFALYEKPQNLAAAKGLPGAQDEARRLTHLEFAIGDVTLVLGYSDGSVEQWLGVRESETDVLKKVRPIRQLTHMPSAITHLIPSGRNKTVLTISHDGTIRSVYTTSAKISYDFNVGGTVHDAVLTPKLTGIYSLRQDGRYQFLATENEHPEINLQMLFGKVWYEGYDAPDYVWQSSSGSDDFEPKYSLTPLTLGTIKGAFYGLLFAIPISIAAALYSSMFMKPEWKQFVKPTVEIMAALPSVVVGFLAGLWLAPLLEDKLPMLLLIALSLPLAVILAGVGWNKLPLTWRSKVPPGQELLILAPMTIAIVALCAWIGPWVDIHLFNGDFRQWVFNVTGEKVEQRNSIVIGIAMGFAVIPIIYTISEDAFSNVPRAFITASYAVGASKWQTAWNVVFPTASPGVFSAVMIGFGRAVGETMIVLMATGNTPIMSFSPFNGMRTLSANIAVEIPEAPIGSTHYRVLFLAALVLFILTFVVNTIAEIIRQNLRDKYKAV